MNKDLKIIESIVINASADLDYIGMSTRLTVTRQGFASQQEYGYALARWKQVLQTIKGLSEKE